MNFVALDFETANDTSSSICQIGIAFFKDAEYQSSWQTLVNPEEYFKDWTVHEITEEMVKDSPTFPSIYKELHEYLTDTIVVHHSPFDITAITQVHLKYGIDLPEIKSLDSLRVARRTWPEYAKRAGGKGHGLEKIAAKLKIKYKPHDAAEDARAAGLVLLHAIEKSGHTLDDWYEKASRPISSRSRSDYKKDINIEANPDGPLFGEVIAFTGTLSILRDEAKPIAAKAGCDVKSKNVTKQTTLLVVGDLDVRQLAAGEVKTKKLQRAEELIANGQSIRILGETDFYLTVAPEMLKH